MNDYTQKVTAIAGAGLTGLMCALNLMEIYPKKKIVVFANLLLLVVCMEVLDTHDALFDYGMRVIYELINRGQYNP